MGLKEKDIKSYLKKARERLAKEKLAANVVVGEEDSETGLVKTKVTGRVSLEGNILSGPIPTVPLNMVAASASTVMNGDDNSPVESSDTGKKIVEREGSPPCKKRMTVEGK